MIIIDYNRLIFEKIDFFPPLSVAPRRAPCFVIFPRIFSEKLAQNAADPYSRGRVESPSGEKGEVQRNSLYQARMAAFPRKEAQRAQEEKCREVEIELSEEM